MIEGAKELNRLRTDVEQLTRPHQPVSASTSRRIITPLRRAVARLLATVRRRLHQAGKLIWWCVTLQIVTRPGQWGPLRRPQLGLPGPASQAAVPGMSFFLWRLFRLASRLRRSRTGGLLWQVARRSHRVRRLARQLLDLQRRPLSQPLSTQPRPADASAMAYEPPVGLLPWFNPLNIEISAELSARPTLNILIPGLASKHLSGGPNTALNLAYRLAGMGVAIRLVSTNASPSGNTTEFWAHVRALAQTDQKYQHIEVVDASDPARKVRFGTNDIFMATAWWTAQMAKYAIRHTRHNRFIYLIQDYESLLHAASTQYALAEETYALDYLPVINTHLLHDFLVKHEVGHFADPDFAAQAIIFEPAVNKSLFFPPASMGSKNKRRLLFYARPTVGLRNAFELGLAALQKLIAEGSLDASQWDFVAMGERVSPVTLGRGAELVAAPWLDLNGYAKMMRESDVLLSPMLSPHPSYPPLEMAACGRPVVTTVFGNKTAERLAAISPNIIGTAATIEGLAGGLLQAIKLAERPRSARSLAIALPSSWSESLATAVPTLHASLLSLFGAPSLPANARLDVTSEANALFPGYRHWPRDGYNTLRYELLAERADLYRAPAPGLISLLTTVWNTDPGFVTELAESVFGQDSGPGFEWIILDNGTTRADTSQLLEQLAARHPAVRLLKAEQNIGIIGGLRRCLEVARNRYIVPLDSDDLLTPDCLRVITSALQTAGYPALAYTDEDKLQSNQFRDPYCKPDWDPVLFTHSCYIAHLCVIDRERALQLGAYTNPKVQGSHDWDSFMRFYLAGHTPLHIPELLYAWRMHEQSTSQNIGSKDYIYSSQRQVIEAFIAHLPDPDRYHIDLSPLFSGTPDWQIVRAAEPAPSITTVMYDTRAAAASPRPDAASDLAQLLAIITSHSGKGEFIHLLSTDARIEDPTWITDAMAMFEAFADTVMVGGRIHQAGNIVAADAYFQSAAGCGSPNVGRPLYDPGYFAQMLKPHSADVVPVEHCVVRADFLADTLRRLAGTAATFAGLACWLGVGARARQQRIVYSPFLLAAVTRRPEQIGAAEQAACVLACRYLSSPIHLLSPRLGLTHADAYQPVTRAVRAGQAKVSEPAKLVDYPTQHAAELMARRITSAVPSDLCTLSLLTTVWNTDPRFVTELAQSVFGQDSGPGFEWIILNNGTTRADTNHLLDQLAARHPAIRLLKMEQNIGIIGGLQCCLQRATGDFIVPIDADDILTVDALHELRNAMSAVDQPTFIYSDEDILSDAGLVGPYRRAAFDAILNAEDSYVWHLCAFRRDRALSLGVYSDRQVEFCHDWDTISRFAEAGERIHHLPHVLYHWRAHGHSSTNNGTIHQGSLQSVKYRLGQTIKRQARPDLYQVGPCQIHRGAQQYAIIRRPVEPLPLILLLNVPSGELEPDVDDRLGSARAIVGERLLIEGPWLQQDLTILRSRLEAAPATLVMVLGADHALPDAAGSWEAMRLFEMHSDVGAVAGRILDENGIVVDCCTSKFITEECKSGWIGKHRADPGNYALALKPQTVSALPPDFFICRAEILVAAIADAEKSISLNECVATACRGSAMRLGYSPLIEAIRHNQQARSSGTG